MKRKWFWILDAMLLVLAGFAIWLCLNLQRGLDAPSPSKLILDRAGNVLGEVPASNGEAGYWPLPVVLPEKIVVATLETEDRYFYEHGGVYFPSVFRALGQNLANGRVVSGASTIAMQVARMQSPGSRSVFRKAKEMIEAWFLIREHGHDRVLRHYLTLAPYGNRVHGIVRAAKFYFDKPIEDISWLQAAFLAGLPQAPGRMDPYQPQGYQRALQRARRILHLLHHRGQLSDQELTQALQSDLRLAPKLRRAEEAMHAVLRLSDLAARHSEPILRASLDLDLQEQVVEILSKNLANRRDRGAGNTACLVVDSHTGEVLAYVGSNDYFDKESHGAIDYVRVKRSPGSTLKPFVYALGVNRGLFSAASELSDIQVEFASASGKVYLPQNINHTYLGPILFREALGNSKNIPALQVMAAVGVEPALEFFKSAGVSQISFEPGQYGLTLVLGGMPVSLEELVGLYGILANGGKTLPLRFFAEEPKKPTKRLLLETVAQQLAHILADPQARLPSFPRGSSLEYDYAVAVKTGTSQGYRDAWAVGFSDRLLIGVWVGNHDWRRMNHVGGLNGAASALHRIMDKLMVRYQPHRTILTEFPPPRGYGMASICPVSGKLAGSECPHRRMEYFAPGTEPVETCSYHRRVLVDRRNGLLASSPCPKKFLKELVMLDLPDSYEQWARHAHLELAPKMKSPFCGGWRQEEEPKVVIQQPTDRAYYYWDPDTPAEFTTIRLVAKVSPAEEEIVWIIDDVPIAQVGYPHEYRWPLSKGEHTIQAAMVHRPVNSRTVSVEVRD